MAELLEQLRSLDRRELVALIREAAARLEALENEDEWELSPAQKAQIDEVVEAYERDGNPGEPWEVVRARIVAGAEVGAVSAEKITA
ncbi:MAG TPA: hypothetical protein VF627_13825 [Abditibacterium sp.]|jgi:hypothetical protein